jgi:predicted GTPase
MPYGDLRKQVVQRYSAYEDFEKHQCTIEEREEYEPLVEQGIVVYAGIDYGQILKQAEKEAEVIIWDGGNNDTPFYKPDIHIVLFDPHRAGHELLYFPGETNMMMADIAVINKVDSAPVQKVWQVRKNIEKYAPKAKIVLAESSVVVKESSRIEGKRVLVVEDGPTLTHGEMPIGAGFIASETFKAAEIVDPRPYARGSLKEIYVKYPHIGSVLPAMGYTPDQIQDLEQTIDQAECDLVVFATPIHLPLVLDIKKPNLRVRYEYKDHDSPTLKELIMEQLLK